MQNINFNERKKIEKMCLEELSYREMGRVLNRSHSSIRAEILSDTCNKTRVYQSARAHNDALSRHQNKGNRPKIERNDELKIFIIEKLRDGWSPEEIAFRTKGRFQIKRLNGKISHETIYKYIYAETNKEYRFYQYLRRHRPKRRKWFSRQKRKTLIPERVSIHERAKVINQRKRFGDFETDSMIFSKQKEILSVQIERLFRLVRINVCPNKTAEETYEAIVKGIDDFPTSEVHSITFDNGTENVKHTKLKKNFEIETYFCDSYKSWQKGAVENMNMLIRQYLPRNTNMSKVTPEETYEIQEKLNNRPRKCLGFLTPNEAYLVYKETGQIII